MTARRNRKAGMTREIPIIVLAIAFAAVLVACVSGTAERAAMAEPATSDQRSAATDRHPATSNQRPAATDRHAATSDQPPQPVAVPARLLATLIDGQGLRSWGVTTTVVDGWLEVRSGHAMPWPSVAVDHAADLSGCGTVAVTAVRLEV